MHTPDRARRVVRRVAQRHPRQTSRERTRVVIQRIVVILLLVSRRARGRGRGLDHRIRRRRRRRFRRFRRRGTRALGRRARSRHADESGCDALVPLSLGGGSRVGAGASESFFYYWTTTSSFHTRLDDWVAPPASVCLCVYARVYAPRVCASASDEAARRAQSARDENSHASH